MPTTRRDGSNRPKMYSIFHAKDKIVTKDKGYTCSDRARSLAKDKIFTKDKGFRYGEHGPVVNMAL